MRYCLFLFLFLWQSFAGAQELVLPVGHSVKPDLMKTVRNEQYLVSVSGVEGRALLWNISQGILSRVLLNEHVAPVASVSADGRYFALATAEERKYELHIYSTDSCREIALVRCPPVRQRYYHGLSFAIEFSSGGDSVWLKALDAPGQFVLVQTRNGRILSHSLQAIDDPYSGMFEALPETTDTLRLRTGGARIYALDNGDIKVSYPDYPERDRWLRKRINTVTSVSLDMQDSLLAAGTEKGEIYVFDLKNNLNIDLLLADDYVNNVALGPAGMQLAVRTDKRLSMWFFKEGRWNREYTVPATPRTARLRFDTSGRYLLESTLSFEAGYPSWGMVLRDVSTGLVLDSVISYREEFEFAWVIEDPDIAKAKLVMSEANAEVVYDSVRNSFFSKHTIGNIHAVSSSLQLSPSGLYANRFRPGNLRDLDWETRYQMSNFLRAALGRQVRYLVYEDQLYDIDGQQVMRQIGDGDFFHTRDYLYSSEGGAITIRSLKDSNALRIILLEDQNYIFQVPPGYYWCSKDAASMINYTKGLQSVSFEQLDLRYNRPDKVLEALGENNDVLLRSYRQAYAKRLKRSGLDTLVFSSDYHVPEAWIAGQSQISYQQAAGQLALKVLAADSVSLLARFQVWVNEVPVFGMQGIDLRGRNLHRWDSLINVSLSDGENRIEISVVNMNGTESFRNPLMLRNTWQRHKPKLYFAGIGINRFADKQHNLQWSVKDIRDLQVSLKEKWKDDFVLLDTLTDGQATKQAIKALREKMERADVDDIVVLAYSGHGLLDSAFDYFLSTYDTDFRYPEKKAVRYEDMEALFDNLPCRQKLLLIDACHSGELDKDELGRIQAASGRLASQGIVARGTITESLETGKLGFRNSFELMQSVFINGTRRTGTTIISAAAGTQFAQERSSLGNGVFTYSILQSMEQQPVMYINELKRRVVRTVERLTEGLQRPVSRSETIRHNWRVW